MSNNKSACLLLCLLMLFADLGSSASVPADNNAPKNQSSELTEKNEPTATTVTVAAAEAVTTTTLKPSPENDASNKNVTIAGGSSTTTTLAPIGFDKNATSEAPTKADDAKIDPSAVARSEDANDATPKSTQTTTPKPEGDTTPTTAQPSSSTSSEKPQESPTKPADAIEPSSTTVASTTPLATSSTEKDVNGKTTESVLESSSEVTTASEKPTELPKPQATTENISKGSMSSTTIALVMAITFTTVVVCVYIGLVLWRRFLVYRYGNRELLVNDLEFDTNDLRHFEL